jgi:hypothetical protein
MNSISDKHAVGYLVRLAAVALIWAAFSIAITVVVDPYRMYGTPGISGWTELKPRIDQQSDLAKTNQLERTAPRTLLLGNSRVEIGFDPESQVWPATYKPVFNAAEAGKGLSTALAMLRDDVAVCPPRTVFLGLDFQDFLSSQDAASAPLPPIGADERRLLVTRQGDKNRDRTLQIWRDRFVTTLTLDALSDSVLTILDQDPKTTATMTSLGFNPLREYTLYARRAGYYGLFLAKAKDYQQQYSRYAKPDFSRADGLANFRDLSSIVALAREHGVKLIVFTQPYHADYLEMLHRLGLWPSFEQWKRSVAQFSSAAGVPLYDFADYNTFTTELIPDRGDTTSEMRWYWEPGHYKETLGDEMLKAMIGGNRSFGRRLTSTNVDVAIIKIRNERELYLSHQVDMARKLWRVGD